MAPSASLRRPEKVSPGKVAHLSLIPRRGLANQVRHLERTGKLMGMESTNETCISCCPTAREWVIALGMAVGMAGAEHGPSPRARERV